MESPIKWIMAKISPVKQGKPGPDVFIRSASKEKAKRKGQTPEKKEKKIRVLEARSRAPLF